MFEKLDEKWDRRFLDMARLVSTWSKDPSTQTGAVIVDQNRRVISVGYNGFAQGVKDYPERYENRELKYKLTAHCERNAATFARHQIEDCCLYTWPFMSCAPCAAMMIQEGIKRAVAPHNDNPRWQEDFQLTQQQFDEAGVELVLYHI